MSLTKTSSLRKRKVKLRQTSFKSTEASLKKLKGVAVKFFLSVFSGLSSTVFSFIYQDNLLKRTMALWSPQLITSK